MLGFLSQRSSKVLNINEAVIYENNLDNGEEIIHSPLIKLGGIVFINKVFYGNFSTNTLIATLPEGFRPKKEYSFSDFARQKSNGEISRPYVIIQTNGSIILGESGSSWDIVPLHACFPTE